MGRGGLVVFLLLGAFVPAAKLAFGQRSVPLFNQPLVLSHVAPSEARFELGLFDCFVTLLVAGLFRVERRPRPRGSLFLPVHGLVRLFLRRLRDEERSLGLTPGQYDSLVSVLPGLFALIFSLLRPRRRVSKSQWENVYAPATRA